MYQAGEDYLKTILLLHKRNGEVREIDIANEMGYTRPSVCYMMKKLVQLGYVEVNGTNVCLTAIGLKLANEIYERHCVIRDFLTGCLAVAPSTAEKDACRMEHILSRETYEALKAVLEKKGGAQAGGVFAGSAVDKGL